MVVYISGGISKVPDFKERFAKAEAELKEKGLEVVNPAKMDDVYPQAFTYDDMMDISFELLRRCDVIYLLEGWKESSGACMEYGYAVASDKMILEEGDPL